jgi:hypothetical protein
MKRGPKQPRFDDSALLREMAELVAGGDKWHRAAQRVAAAHPEAAAASQTALVHRIERKFRERARHSAPRLPAVRRYTVSAPVCVMSPSLVAQAIPASIAQLAEEARRQSPSSQDLVRQLFPPSVKDLVQQLLRGPAQQR